MPLFFCLPERCRTTNYFSIDLLGRLLGKLPITTVSLGMFLAGLFTVAQFSFWGNYLPRVYPIHLRGTGESFAANIGGRMIGTSFAALTSFLANSVVPGESLAAKYAMASAGVAFVATLVAVVACFFLPEPRPETEE